MNTHFRNARSGAKPSIGGKTFGNGNSGGFRGGRFGRSGSSRAGRSFGATRSGGYRGGRGGGQRGPKPQRINTSMFINKVVTTEEMPVFKPEHKFSDFAVDQRLIQSVITKGYVDPTPIQDKSIPHILKGKDIVGIANTGTGKTAAFLIPLINKVLLNKKEQVMIIVPTRELALQIEQELRAFTKNMGIFSVCCVGGMPIGRQISFLKYHNSFVIGTPGRLKDLMDRGCIKPANFNTIVLDEADRMLDMGFVNDMRHVMSQMPKNRHTLFFSATLSQDIEKLIGEFLNEPVRISVKTGDTSKNVEQDVVRVGFGKNKLDVLHELLSQNDFNKVIVFGRTKHGVEKLSKSLIEKGLKADSIHGDKNHSKRQQALKQFKEGHVQVLVATDVAARGLDIADVSHVINYELPMTYDDYVHRIGRTGRGNKRGKALTFLE